MRVTKRHAPTGFVAVDRPMAESLFSRGVAVTVAGSNVNSYHIFGGWCLGCQLAPYQKDHVDGLDRLSFSSQVGSFTFYLEPELGRYPVFYVSRCALGGARK